MDCPCSTLPGHKFIQFIVVGWENHSCTCMRKVENNYVKSILSLFSAFVQLPTLARQTPFITGLQTLSFAGEFLRLCAQGLPLLPAYADLFPGLSEVGSNNLGSSLGPAQHNHRGSNGHGYQGSTLSSGNSNSGEPWWGRRFQKLGLDLSLRKQS